MIAPMRFRITSVDHNGYNGRENHPTDAMIGEIVVPIQLYVEIYDAEGEWVGTPNDLNPDERVRVLEQADKDGGCTQMWTCVRPNGDLVDLVDHEIEEVK